MRAPCLIGIVFVVTLKQADIGGKTQEVYRTACRQADGSSQIVK